MKRKSIAVIAIPTGSLFKSPGRVGVFRPMIVTVSIHIAMPTAPMINKNFRPYLSAVHIAFKVNMIPRVALSALMSAILVRSGNTFL